MANVTVTIRTVDGAAAPVDGVLVTIKDGVGTYLTEGTTDALGEVAFILNGDVAGIDYLAVLTKNGWNFPPAPTHAFSVTDPPSPSNDFEFTGYEGASALVTTIITEDNAVPANQVEGVRAWVYTAADVYITEGDTDVNGEVDFILDGSADPGTEYILRLRKDGYEFSPGETAKISVIDPLGVGQVNEFVFTLTAHTIPESSDPDMCMLSGYLVNSSLHRLADVTVDFHPRFGFNEYALGFHYPNDPSLVRRNVIIDGVVTKTDGEGYLEVSLPRGGVYDVHIHGMKHPSEIISPIVVPDAAGWKLEDVFFPYALSVTYGSDPISVVVDGSTEVDLTSLLSNGLILEVGADVTRFLRFSSSDESVATVEVTEDAKLLVHGISAGTATVEVARVAGTWAPRRPSLPDVLATPPTVEVA